MDGDLLIECEFWLLLWLDLLGDGVWTVLESHFTGELDFHFNRENGEVVVIEGEFLWW